MVKKVSKYFSVIGLFLLFFSCKDAENTIHKSTDGSEKKYNTWFAHEANFQQKSVYKEKFTKAYNHALNQKDYKNANELLLSAFKLMHDSGVYDNYYIGLLYDYLKKYESKLTINDVLSFYAQIGEYQIYNGDYQKCISTLQKVTLLQPYNYQTFSEKGNIYYCLSNAYFNSGDVDKAMDENENAIACFNKTDNYQGQALVLHNKASMSFESGNEAEAIAAIDKTMALYKKLDDMDGLVSASINKYEFTVKDQPAKAHPYLDSISVIIKTGKVKSNFSLLHFNTLKLRKFVKEKNIVALDTLLPEMEAQAQKINLPYWNDEMVVFKSQYDVLKYGKVLGKDKLLSILADLKKNNNISYSAYIINILRDEAAAQKDLNKVLAFSKEIEEIEKKLSEEDIQFKVKTYEKKIDTAKKEKIIAQQNAKLSRSYTYIFGLIGLLVSSVGLFWIFSLRRKRKLAILAQEKQEQFTLQLLQNTEEERSRIANELHDGVNHDLLNIKNNLINGKTIAADDVAFVIEEVRNISRNLHPAVLETIGLEASIESLCEKLSEIGLFTTCEIDYTEKFNKSKELQLYRIIQEALNNTLKHGKANAAKVILTSQTDGLHLEIKDNGNGFDVASELKNPKSFGLQSIIQRAKAIAAKIKIDTTNKGTIIHLNVPL